MHFAMDSQPTNKQMINFSGLKMMTVQMCATFLLTVGSVKTQIIVLIMISNKISIKANNVADLFGACLTLDKVDSVGVCSKIFEKKRKEIKNKTKNEMIRLLKYYIS